MKKLLPKTGNFRRLGKKICWNLPEQNLNRNWGQEMAVAEPLPDNNHNMIKCDI